MAEKYYTPKEYEAAFNEPWGGRDAVYFVDYAEGVDGSAQRFWRAGALGDLIFLSDLDLESGEVLCATAHCPADDYVHAGSGGAGNAA